MAMRSSLVEVSQVSTPRILVLTYTGKTIRDGMGQATDLSSEDALDLVITNALILDWSGIYKVL
jgi:urease alpha subunit